MKSSFLQKYEPNIVRIFALYCATVHKLILKFTDLYRFIHSIYIKTVSSKLFFKVGIFDSFLAGVGRNRVYVPINQFSKAYCPNIYIRSDTMKPK